MPPKLRRRVPTRASCRKMAKKGTGDLASSAEMKSSNQQPNGRQEEAEKGTVVSAGNGVDEGIKRRPRGLLAKISSYYKFYDRIAVSRLGFIRFSQHYLFICLAGLLLPPRCFKIFADTPVSESIPLLPDLCRVFVFSNSKRKRKKRMLYNGGSKAAEKKTDDTTVATTAAAANIVNHRKRSKRESTMKVGGSRQVKRRPSRQQQTAPVAHTSSGSCGGDPSAGPEKQQNIEGSSPLEFICPGCGERFASIAAVRRHRVVCNRRLSHEFYREKV
jgi:hypothetical protein